MDHTLAWGVVVLALTVVVGLWGRQRIRQKRARLWPTCSGTVASTAVRLEGVGTEQRYIAEMHYSYTVGDVSYFGRLRRSFMLHSRAHGWAGGYHSGRRLVVRYNPADSADSELFEDEQGGGTAAA